MHTSIYNLSTHIYEHIEIHLSNIFVYICAHTKNTFNFKRLIHVHLELLINTF